MTDNSADEYELCPSCNNKATDFDDRWVGCVLCTYWICLDCAYKSLPGAEPQNKGSKNAKKFYDSLKGTTSSPWQYFCSNCIMKLPSLKSTPSKITNNVSEQITKLTNTVNELAKKITSLEQQLRPIATAATSPTWAEIAGINSPQKLSKVVKTSVQSALDSEKTKCKLIISRLDESGSDLENVLQIGKSVGSQTKPVDVQRLGQKSAGTSRLLKVTFSSFNDPRNFRLSFDKNKMTSDSLKSIKIRPSIDKEKRKLHKQKSNLVHQMNQEAKERGEHNVSYSLREDYAIWKFVKDNDSWKRDRNWQESATSKVNQKTNQSKKEVLLVRK